MMLGSKAFALTTMIRISPCLHTPEILKHLKSVHFSPKSDCFSVLWPWYHIVKELNNYEFSIYRESRFEL